MNLQPLYDVKARLEQAAIAGTGLLAEDFRLQRAVESLKPLAAASPVFGKIDAGLTRLLAAPAAERSGLLLDVLALVDAVAYTQAKTGIDGELEPLPTDGGSFQQISYGQISPLLTALTTTGGGRQEAIKSAWENHPEFFTDFRILPALVKGLGDSYGEIADQNGKILVQVGPAALPTLKRGFDPAGKKEMARRVEVIAAIEGPDATPWLREMLPQAKKDVRAAVIAALGEDRENTALLLELAKTERGKNRDAALTALARQDGEKVIEFWEAELGKNGESVRFLGETQADWASDLVAEGLRTRLEEAISSGARVDTKVREELSLWLAPASGKSSPAMLDFWRWADRLDICALKNNVGQSLGFEENLTNILMHGLCQTGPGPLCALCLELWERHPKEPRYLSHGVVAALMTRSAAEVYDAFSPYVPTMKPLLGGQQKQALHNAVLRGLSRLARDKDGVYRIDGTWPAAQPLDKRWIKRLTHSLWKTPEGDSVHYYGTTEKVGGFDAILMRLADGSDPEVRNELIAYLRQRMKEVGNHRTYCRWLFELGGSPRGVLGASLKKGKPVNLYHIWELLNEAAKSLPASEVAGLCQEVLDAKWIRSVGVEQLLAEQVIPRTIEQLRAGEPFPVWDDWWNGASNVAKGVLQNGR